METSSLNTFNKEFTKELFVIEHENGIKNETEQFLALVEKLESGLTEEEIAELRILKNHIHMSEEATNNSSVQTGLKKWKAFTSSSFAVSLIRQLKKELSGSSHVQRKLAFFITAHFKDYITCVNTYKNRKSDQNAYGVWNRFCSHLISLECKEQLMLGNKRFLRYFFPSCIGDTDYLLRNNLRVLSPTTSLHQHKMTQFVAPPALTKANSVLRDAVVVYTTINDAVGSATNPSWRFTKKGDLALFYQKNFCKIFPEDYMRLEIAAFRLALLGNLSLEEKQQLVVNIRFSETLLPQELRIANWKKYASFIGYGCTAASYLQELQEVQNLEIRRGSIVGAKRSNGTYMFGVVSDIGEKEVTVLFRNKDKKQVPIHKVIVFSEETLEHIRMNPGMLLVGTDVPTHLVNSLAHFEEEDLTLGSVCVVTRSSGELQFGFVEGVTESENPLISCFLQEKVSKKTEISSLKLLSTKLINSTITPLTESDEHAIAKEVYNVPCCGKLIQIIESIPPLKLQEEQKKLFEFPLVFGSFAIEDEEKIREFTQTGEKTSGIFKNISLEREIHAIFCEENHLQEVQKLLGPLLTQANVSIPILSLSVAQFHALRLRE